MIGVILSLIFNNFPEIVSITVLVTIANSAMYVRYMIKRTKQNQSYDIKN